MSHFLPEIHSVGMTRSSTDQMCVRIAMVAALVAIAGCDGGDGGGGGLPPPGGTSSCRAALPGADGGMGMVALCLEVSGGTAQDQASARQQCMAQGNTFAATPCPREGALGGCRETVVGASLAVTTWYYQDSSGLGTSDDIRMLCEQLASVAPTTITIQFVLP